MVRATVITDASWCHRTLAGGWAAWVNVNYPDGGHRRYKEAGRFKESARSSTHAEQLACMNGIFIAYEAGARRILVQTDLLILVHTNGATKNEALSRNFREGRKRYFKDAIIEWRHVKGHNLSKVNDRRTYVNDWCDKRAKIQMRKQRGDIDSARQQSQVR